MALTTVRPQGMGFNTGRRNMVINGAMQVSQRGTSETGVTSGGYKQAPDRWIIAGSSAGTWTVSQSSTVPSGEGFSYSYKLDCTTADASLSAGDHWVLAHYIEAQNVAHLGYSTSSAKKITLSFWVRSAKTGTYVLEIVRNDSDRHIAQTYTISSADTWEHKTLTFDADTGGSAIPHDNGRGFEINFWLAAGSTFSGGTLATSWATKVAANRAAGVVNLADSTSNDWYVTGVQLELGENASDFEHRSFGEELALCQRYYQKIGPAADGSAANRTIYGLGFVINSSNFRPLINFPVKFRTAPGAIETSGTASHFSCSFGADSSQALNSVPTYDVANSTSFFGGCNLSGTPLNTSEVVVLRSNHADSYLAWDAEL